MKASHCTGETGHVAVLKPGALFEKAMEKKISECVFGAVFNSFVQSEQA